MGRFFSKDLMVRRSGREGKCLKVVEDLRVSYFKVTETNRKFREVSY